MDCQITRCYVVDKDYGKQMVQRLFLYQAFRQGLKRSIDKGVVVVWISKTWCRRSSIYWQRHWITIAFKDVISNAVGATAKSPSLCEFVRTFILSGMASAASTRNFGYLNYPVPSLVRVIPSAKYLMVLRVSLKTDKFAPFRKGPFSSIGPQFPERKSLSNSYSNWNLAEAYFTVFAES